MVIPPLGKSPDQSLRLFNWTYSVYGLSYPVVPTYESLLEREDIVAFSRGHLLGVQCHQVNSAIALGVQFDISDFMHGAVQNSVTLVGLFIPWYGLIWVVVPDMIRNLLDCLSISPEGSEVEGRAAARA
ncbi:hypothetical protein SCAR479_10079 [Seiridium cardinale]|uniref:Uncharacterized protein n=1 Tax=Seiridium cardinale TaxID=138064 RepID=A0ABR2XHD3_9PEZI